jgi:hypothetical protein
VIRTLALLIGGTAAFWLAAAFPAYLLWGGDALLFSGVAAGLCLVPMTLTLAWGSKALRGAPEQALLAVMGGTGLRLVFVVGIAMALYLSLPEFHSRAFWLWVIVFYLVTLTLEMALLLTRHGGVSGSQDGRG